MRLEFGVHLTTVGENLIFNTLPKYVLHLFSCVDGQNGNFIHLKLNLQHKVCKN